MQLEELKSKYEEEKVSKSKLEEDISKLRDYYDSRIHDVEGKHASHLPSTSEGETWVCLFLVAHFRCHCCFPYVIIM